MGIKSKVGGVLAAVGLSMSLIVGAGAQETPDTVDGTVSLNAGACGIVATAGTADFGEWTWNGSEWAQGEQNAFVYLTVTTPWSRGADASTCDLTVGTHGLFHVFGSRQAPPLTEDLFRAGFGQPAPGGGWTGSSMMDLPATHAVKNGDVRVQLELQEIPADSWSGEYSGTFDFTISDGQ